MKYPVLTLLSMFMAIPFAHALTNTYAPSYERPNYGVVQIQAEAECKTRSEMIANLTKVGERDGFKIAFHSFQDESTGYDRLFAISSNRAATWWYDADGCVTKGIWVPSTDAVALEITGKTKAELLGE
jgi:hypothetical protein